MVPLITMNFITMKMLEI